MGRDYDQDGERKRASAFSYICSIIHFTLIDVILYGCVIPLIGTYVAGVLTYKFGMTPKWELVTTVLVTFAMIYGTFCVLGESSYWKHLFALDSFYCNLLQIRDVINGAMFIVCLCGLATTVEGMVNQDKGMKTVYVSEGATYVFLKTILQFLNIDPDNTLESFGFKPPRRGTIIDPSLGENEKYERGAAYMLLWAMLSGCVAKLVYYNTLFTYLRAMEVFMSMRPYFDEDDEYDDSRSTLNSRTGRTPSRLDNDFAHSVRRASLN